MPILGTIASSFRAGAGTSYESIATSTVGSGGASSVTFSNIPSTYSHLQIRGIARVTRSGQNNGELAVQLNSDSTTTNYRSHLLNSDGSTVSHQISQDWGGIYALRVPGSSALTNSHGTFVIDILDYNSTNKNKTLRMLTAFENNGNDYFSFVGGLWLNSSTAVNSVSIILAYGTSIEQYSHFALYGIKAA